MKTVRKTLYIDIDGVILTRGGIPAAHLDEFLKYALKNYSVMWLTSRCRGDSKYTVGYLGKFVQPETLSLLKKIQPTDFKIDKTEAIDFNKNFLWLDDDLFDSEKKILDKHNKLSSWIEVNLLSNPNQLLDLVNAKFAVGK